MNQKAHLFFYTLLTSSLVLAEPTISTPRPSFDVVSCSDQVLIKEYLNSSPELISSTTHLLKICSENMLDIAAVAVSQDPLLTRDTYSIVFKKTPEKELLPTIINVLTSLKPEQRADAESAAIESAPPNLIQEIMNAIAEANLMPPEDILIAAIAGGADPAAITEPTAAGISLPPPITLTPGVTNTFGTGNGNLGGTASPN